MRRVARVVLIALSINCAILLVSLRMFHDLRSLYRSINVGDKVSDIYPRLTNPNPLACHFTSTDRQSGVCIFSDFWHNYGLIFENGVITEKRYNHITDLLHPKVPLPLSSLKWFVGRICLLLAGALGASIWYARREPEATNSFPGFLRAPREP